MCSGVLVFSVVFWSFLTCSSSSVLDFFYSFVVFSAFLVFSDVSDLFWSFLFSSLPLFSRLFCSVFFCVFWCFWCFLMLSVFSGLFCPDLFGFFLMFSCVFWCFLLFSAFLVFWFSGASKILWCVWCSSLFFCLSLSGRFWCTRVFMVFSGLVVLRCLIVFSGVFRCFWCFVAFLGYF